MTRHKIREHIFKLLYMSAFAGKDADARLMLYLDELDDTVNRSDPEGEDVFEADDSEVTDLTEDGLFTEDERYLIEVKYRRIREHLDEIDGIIGKTSRGWRTDRMAKVDLAILRLAVYEVRFDDTIPEGVAINEAVELAKEFGGDDSPSFINGILGVVAKMP